MIKGLNYDREEIKTEKKYDNDIFMETRPTREREREINTDSKAHQQKGAEEERKGKGE